MDSTYLGGSEVERMRIKANGNVGIGTTGPGNLLELAKAGAVLEINDTTAGDGDPTLMFSTSGAEKARVLYDESLSQLSLFVAGGHRLVVEDTGNVGIGTTAPSQKLHIAGNCVTLDTILPIRRKKRKKNGDDDDDENLEDSELKDREKFRTPNGSDNQKIPQNGTLVNLTNSLKDWSDNLKNSLSQKYGLSSQLGVDLPGVEPGRRGLSDQSSEPAKPTPTSSITQPNDAYDYLLLPINQVLPGDEVMSLNEQTNTLQYVRINKLIHMGHKEVYEVKLKSGRTIKTTSEHPFLTLNTQVRNQNFGKGSEPLQI